MAAVRALLQERQDRRKAGLDAYRLDIFAPRRFFAEFSVERLWEPADNLTNCKAAIAAFEQVTGRLLPRPGESPCPATAVRSCRWRACSHSGYTLDAAPLGDLGASTGGPTTARGNVARLCPRGAFKSLHELASWVLPAAGMARALRPRPPTGPK